MPVPPPEIVTVKDKLVSCDGDEGALGHPAVYLKMDDGGQVDCPYCDRLFVLKGGPADGNS